MTRQIRQQLLPVETGRDRWKDTAIQQGAQAVEDVWIFRVRLRRSVDHITLMVSPGWQLLSGLLTGQQVTTALVEVQFAEAVIAVAGWAFAKIQLACQQPHVIGLPAFANKIDQGSRATGRCSMVRQIPCQARPWADERKFSNGKLAQYDGMLADARAFCDQAALQ